MKTIQVALATSEKYPDLYDDDQSILGLLLMFGIEATPVIWDQKQDWTKFDKIVIRSTWDYWSKIQQYREWIIGLDKEGIKVVNPAPVLLDNTNKNYLKRIAKRGIPMPRTVWIDESSKNLKEIMKINKFEEVVLKPAISAGAFRTYRFKIGQAEDYQEMLEEILKDSVALCQPMITTILTEGEYSFIFFAGQFSHAVLKKGAQDDFRIQRTYGGTVQKYEPKLDEIDQAQRALGAYCDAKKLAYSRVDMVRDPENSRRLLLMELELTEPNLFFLYAPDQARAVKLFSETIIG